jgi:isopentenyldiphosphate isomerase
MEYYVYAYMDSNELIETEYCGIYFKNRPIYIGKGKNKRMFDHLKDRKRLKTLFYNKLNKMIREDNSPVIIKLKEFSSEQDALNFEYLLIENIKNIKNNGLLYNTTDGGVGFSGYIFTDEDKERMRKNAIENKSYLYFPDNSGEKHPMYGKNHSKESIDKMIKSRIGKKQSNEWIENRVSKLRGVPLSEDHKKKLSDINKGKFVSEDTKKKISESKIGSTPWNQGLMKDIILQIDFDNNIVKEWNSLIEIEKSGFQKSNVINVCNGKRKSHKGYKWIYKSKFK